MEAPEVAVPVAEDPELPELPEGVRKEVLSEPTQNYLRPTAGDEVHIHFRGWLPDGTEFHNTRSKPGDFDFTLGEGEINKGLDLGIATMCKGERAKFTLSPELAYGEGIPGKIPPHAVLTFEVELLWWRRKNALTPDGGVVKVVQVEGDGCKKPFPGCIVKIRYTGYANGIEFAASSDDGVEAEVTGLNALKLPQRTWQIVLASMSRHEHAVVTLTPPYAYGADAMFDSKVPGNSTVRIDMQLLDVFLVSDCSLFQRCGERHFPRVTKTQMSDGDATGTKPNNLSQVTALVNGTLSGEVSSWAFGGRACSGPVLLQLFPGKQVTWQLMAGRRCEAVECAVLSMTKGEKSLE